MIIKIANTWADWIVNNGADADDHDVYLYGAECMLNEVFSDFVLILTALLFHKVFETFTWMVFFTPLRIHLGGIHATSHLKCILSSLFLCFLCIYTYPLIVDYPVIISIILAISLFTVYKIAPVVHPNHPVSEDRMLKMRKMALLVVCIEISITIIAYTYFSQKLGGLGIVSIFSVCILAILGKLHSFKTTV